MLQHLSVVVLNVLVGLTYKGFLIPSGPLQRPNETVRFKRRPTRFSLRALLLAIGIAAIGIVLIGVLLKA